MRCCNPSPASCLLYDSPLSLASCLRRTTAAPRCAAAGYLPSAICHLPRVFACVCCVFAYTHSRYAPRATQRSGGFVLDPVVPSVWVYASARPTPAPGAGRLRKPDPPGRERASSAPRALTRGDGSTFRPRSRQAGAAFAPFRPHRPERTAHGASGGAGGPQYRSARRRRRARSVSRVCLHVGRFISILSPLR
jgi:hypothetical protein